MDQERKHSRFNFFGNTDTTDRISEEEGLRPPSNGGNTVPEQPKQHKAKRHHSEKDVPRESTNDYQQFIYSEEKLTRPSMLLAFISRKLLTLNRASKDRKFIPISIFNGMVINQRVRRLASIRTTSCCTMGARITSRLHRSVRSQYCPKFQSPTTKTATHGQ